jgi:hypothetical protein
MPSVARAETPSFDDIDLFSTFVFGNPMGGSSAAARLATATEMDLKVLPPANRLRAWSGMAWRRQFAFRDLSTAWRYLVPEWLSCRARNLPLARRS